jgi:hypothetical protein
MTARRRVVSISQWANIAGMADDSKSLAAAPSHNKRTEASTALAR